MLSQDGDEMVICAGLINLVELIVVKIGGVPEDKAY